MWYNDVWLSNSVIRFESVLNFEKVCEFYEEIF